MFRICWEIKSVRQDYWRWKLLRCIIWPLHIKDYCYALSSNINASLFINNESYRNGSKSKYFVWRHTVLSLFAIDYFSFLFLPSLGWLYGVVVFGLMGYIKSFSASQWWLFKIIIIINYWSLSSRALSSTSKVHQYYCYCDIYYCLLSSRMSLFGWHFQVQIDWLKKQLSINQ